MQKTGSAHPGLPRIRGGTNPCSSVVTHGDRTQERPQLVLDYGSELLREKEEKQGQKAP